MEPLKQHDVDFVLNLFYFSLKKIAEKEGLTASYVKYHLPPDQLYLIPNSICSDAGGRNGLENHTTADFRGFSVVAQEKLVHKGSLLGGLLCAWFGSTRVFFCPWVWFCLFGCILGFRPASTQPGFSTCWKPRKARGMLNNKYFHNQRLNSESKGLPQTRPAGWSTGLFLWSHLGLDFFVFEVRAWGLGFEYFFCNEISAHDFQPKWSASRHVENTQTNKSSLEGHHFSAMLKPITRRPYSCVTEPSKVPPTQARRRLLSPPRPCMVHHMPRLSQTQPPERADLSAMCELGNKMGTRNCEGHF